MVGCHAELVSASEPLLSAEDLDHLGRVTLSYLASNVHQLYDSVIPELKDEAKQMLYDFWGEEFVKKVEKAIEKQE